MYTALREELQELGDAYAIPRRSEIDDDSGDGAAAIGGEDQPRLGRNVAGYKLSSKIELSILLLEYPYR